MNLQTFLIRRTREGLDSRGWSQAELARVVGITEKHMSSVLTGKVPGSLPLWSNMLTVLEVNLERHAEEGQPDL
jgi:transcriptional regulator with XRE-family HTH domain